MVTPCSEMAHSGWQVHMCCPWMGTSLEGMQAKDTCHFHSHQGDLQWQVLAPPHPQGLSVERGGWGAEGPCQEGVSFLEDNDMHLHGRGPQSHHDTQWGSTFLSNTSPASDGLPYTSPGWETAGSQAAVMEEAQHPPPEPRENPGSLRGSREHTSGTNNHTPLW